MTTKTKLSGRQWQELYEWFLYLYNKGYSADEIAQMTNLSVTRQRIGQLIQQGPATLEKLKTIKIQ